MPVTPYKREQKVQIAGMWRRKKYTGLFHIWNRVIRPLRVNNLNCLNNLNLLRFLFPNLYHTPQLLCQNIKGIYK